MTSLEVIKIISVIKKGYDFVKSFLQKPKIEVFPNQEFRKPPGTYWIDEKGIEHPQRPSELFDKEGSVSVSITNYGKESIRLDQITLKVSVKKGFLHTQKVIDEIITKKFTHGLPFIISPGNDKKLTFRTKFDSTEKGTFIYEVIAIINNRPIKHVHKVKR